MGQIKNIKDDVKQQMPAWHWGTVTELNPLRVRRGGDPSDWPTTPSAIYRPRAVGERVLMLHVYKRLIVLGRAGGDPAGPDMLEINGQLYRKSGTWEPQQLSNPNYSGNSVYAWTLSKAVPYEPPEGWTFDISMAYTNGFCVVQNAQSGTGGGAIAARLIGLGSQSPTVQLRWKLVPNG